MHLKRRAIPKTWPMAKKGTKYIVVPSERGLPVLVVIRDVLKFAQDRKETKKILNAGLVSVNGRQIKEEKYALKLFDILKLKDKFYKMIIENRRYGLEEVKEKDASSKIVKIIGKKIRPGKKVQINLEDGRNYLTKEKFKIGDSAVVNFKEGIKGFIPLKEKSKVLIKRGKHIGKVGIIEKLSENLAEIKVNAEKINVNLNSLVALE